MQDWTIGLRRKREEHQKILNEARSEFMKGKNNPRWNGGISEYSNQPELKRKRIEVFRISKGKCLICGQLAKIIHHIDGDKSNHSFINLMALCRSCHKSLHKKSNKNKSSLCKV